MQKIFTFLLFLSFCSSFAQTSEKESNNSFATANYIKQDSTKTGNLNGTSDILDYFVTKTSEDGTIKLVFNATNTSLNSGYLYLYVFDGRNSPGQIFTKYIGNTSNVGGGNSINDTILLYGKAIDSLYFRLDASVNFSYSMSYKILDTSPNDLEPNNTFNKAISIDQLQEKKGHVNYIAKGVLDTDDFYGTKLKNDGTLKIYVTGTNTSGNTAYLYLYGYDGRKNSGQVLARYISNNSSIPAGKTIYDTIIMYGRARDSFYFRFQSSASFQYSFKYDITDTTLEDIEPNNQISEANYIAPLEVKNGHIRYASNGTFDIYDYYTTSIPYDGTLKIYVKGSNQSGTTSFLYLYGYDGRKLSGQILSRYISNNSSIGAGKTFYDTITLYGRATDSFYFRFEASAAFNYSFKFEMLDSSRNDSEPNNLINEAVSVSKLEQKYGHVRYASNGGIDVTDYYKTKFAYDGTVAIYVEGTNQSGNTAFLYLYGFDGRKNSGQILAKYISNNSSIAAGKTIYDTIYLSGRAIDSFYFKFESSAAFQYKFKYDISDSSRNDLEPNGTIQEALFVSENEEKFGHVYYAANGIIDNSDYYKTLLKQDGTVKIYVKATNTSFSNSYFFLYGFDGRKLSGQILAKYISNNSSIAPQQTIYDTIYLYGRGVDSLYFRFDASSSYKYSFKYEIIDQSVNDIEPNNSFAEATLTNLGRKELGHIGYFSKGVRDNDDLYKIAMPKFGSVQIISEISNKNGSPGYVFVYGYDDRKGSGQILAKYVGSSNTLAGTTVKDTILVNCVNTDTFYLRVTSSGSFHYNFTHNFINRMPSANTQNERIGNTVGFRPQLANATSFAWDFGDGTKSTLKYPMKTYGIGFYPTKLIVTNSVCNYKDTSQEDFTISGVEYYTPDSSGTGGDAIVKIFGAGLDTSTKVTLKKGSIEITPIRKFTVKNFVQLQAVFDLHLVDEGTYDMIIEIKGQAPLIYPNGFKIKKFRYPYTWSQVVAPSRWRTNVDNKFKLVVGNTGNVNASGVLVAFLWPKSVNLKFDNKWFKPPASGDYNINIPGSTFKFKWEDVQHFYSDTFNTITSIDTFNGKPYNGYMQMILIPKIGAGSTYEIPLIARSSTTGAQNFITFTFKPNLFGSCPGGSWMDIMENLGVEAADGLDQLVSLSPVLEKSPVGWLTKATKGTTQHMANLGQVMGAFYNYASGTTNSIDESLPANFYSNVDVGNVQFANAVTGVVVDKFVEKGADKFMKGQTDRLNDFIAKNPNASASSFEFAIDNLNDINDIRQKIKDMYKNTKDLKTLSDKLARLSQLVKDCPELQKQIDDLKNELEKDMNLKDPRETKTNSVTSMDPNAIYGPSGQGINQYINNSDRQHFLITFENMDTALAAAQIVTVIDTLDKTKFDVRTFEFGDYTLGTRTFVVPKGRQQFVFEDSLSPSMRVRVNARLDSLKGIVTWQFTAIDPITKDIPVFEGFLNPNVNKPEGEGSGSFTIKPRLPIVDGAIFKSRASIIFDGNEPILTNTWQNIVDVLPPSSSVSASVKSGHTNIELTFTGNDATSGVGYHSVFVKEGNGPWQAFGGTSENTLTLNGEPGKTYSFYSISNDMVGNVEKKSPAAETSVSIGSVSTIIAKNRLNVHPNPAGIEITIDGLKYFKDYVITDMIGKTVLREKTSPDYDQIDISMLNPGMYIITINGSVSQSIKFIKK
jgi:hypothetical protein